VRAGSAGTPVRKAAAVRDEWFIIVGGAIALGHPLGAAGTIRSAHVIHAMRRKDLKHRMVTICVGTGMGATGIFERV